MFKKPHEKNNDYQGDACINVLQQFLFSMELNIGQFVHDACNGVSL